LWLLRHAMSEHTRIACFLAIIVVGTNVNIIFELPITNLRMFLDGRQSQFKLTSKALLYELSSLAGVLEFLHDEAMIKMRKRRSVIAHLDLKPENILIYHSLDPETDGVGLWKISDFGLWKISDFGISSIEKSSSISESTSYDRAAYNSLSMSSITGGLKKLMDTRSISRYTAPEIALSMNFVRSRAGDIWAFGCVLTEVLAKAIIEREYEDGKVKRVTNSDGDGGYPNRIDLFYQESKSGALKLHPAIASWVDSLPRRPNHDSSFLVKSRALILSTLNMQAERRPNASQLCKSLCEILESADCRSSFVREIPAIISHMKTEDWSLNLNLNDSQYLSTGTEVGNVANNVDGNEEDCSDTESARGAPESVSFLRLSKDIIIIANHRGRLER